jgi:transcriptional regulator with PAS, ATPase and Fis domain
MSSPSPPQPWSDDRTPYDVAAAVVRVIQRLAPGFANEEAVWQAFANWRGAALGDYLRAVRQTEHAVFYYQMQYLYEFGSEQVPAAQREDFCYSAGRHFLTAVVAETLFPLLQVALAQPGTFQATVVDMIRMYMNRFGGNKYDLRAELRPGEIVLTVADRFPAEIAEYARQYALDPERCFRNSFQFIAGAMEEFVAQVVQDYRPPAAHFHCTGQRGQIRLPVAEDDRFAYDRLLQTLVRFTQQVQTHLRAQEEETQLQSDLVIGSAAMREAWERIHRASKSDELVLLLGESGTGKTFIARKIHTLSRRRDGPFIHVNLTSDVGSDNLIQSNLFGHERGAFTGATEQKQGLFSLAHGGTIFLDEIGDASPELQAKLLHVIESSTFKRLGGVRDLRVEVRVIAATNRDLEQMTSERKFREDLYFRLNVIPIRVPPLRERLESVPALVEFLLGRIARASNTLPKKVSLELLSLLQQYAWPGNIRELEHALKHAVAMSDSEQLTLEDLPAGLRESLQGRRASAPVAKPPAEDYPGVINQEALRRVLRASEPKAAANAARKHELPAHIEYAKRAYLAALIDEFKGDLSLIGCFWDHHSEKTLRALIRAYGLEPHWQAARVRARAENQRGEASP